MTLLGAVAGSLNVASGITPISIAGTLSASGSTATVTGTAQVVTVPVGNSGDIRFNNVTSSDSGTLQYSKNGGAFTLITEDLIVNFADTNTLQIRSIGMTSPEIDSIDVTDDDTGSLIEAMSIERT